MGHQETTSPKGALAPSAALDVNFGRSILMVLVLCCACTQARILPPGSPFPPRSRWEKILDGPLASPLASDGTLVFAALSTGPVMAMDPATGATRLDPAGAEAGVRGGSAGLGCLCREGRCGLGDRRSGRERARWKTSTNVTEVESVRLDGNRVFLGGASGFAAVMVSTGELRFDLTAKGVRDIDVAGDSLASVEDGALIVRGREDGAIRFRLASPEGEFGAPAIFPDGRLVVGSGNRLVRSVSARGEFTWRFKVGARVKDRPLDFLDGKRVGVISFEGVFYELSLKGGDMKRRVLLSSRPFGPPVLLAGRVWAPIFEDEIVAIDPRTEKLLGRARFGGGFLSSPLLVAGRLLAEISGPRRIVALETAPVN